MRILSTARWAIHRALDLILRPWLPESARLARAWAGYSPESLDSYLVSGYQNPRINLQSILARHAIAQRLFGSAFEGLMNEEIRFAIEMNDILRTRAMELGIRIGSYLDPTKQARVRKVDAAIAGRDREFERRWADAVRGREAGRLRILELACGSANDYRSWADYGLAPYLDYTGIDLNSTNVANARRRFPDVDFRVGDILDLPLADGSVDLVVASDIFEHLSFHAMDRALDEAIRVAREGLILTFFAMGDLADHVEVPTGAYHRNRLSRSRIEARLAAAYGMVEVTPVARWLAREFGYRHSYNGGAYTIVTRSPLVGADAARDGDRHHPWRRAVWWWAVSSAAAWSWGVSSEAVMALQVG